MKILYQSSFQDIQNITNTEFLQFLQISKSEDILEKKKQFNMANLYFVLDFMLFELLTKLILLLSFVMNFS